MRTAPPSEAFNLLIEGPDLIAPLHQRLFRYRTCLLHLFYLHYAALDTVACYTKNGFTEESGTEAVEITPIPKSMGFCCLQLFEIQVQLGRGCN